MIEWKLKFGIMNIILSHPPGRGELQEDCNTVRPSPQRRDVRKKMKKTFPQMHVYLASCAFPSDNQPAYPIIPPPLPLVRPIRPRSLPCSLSCRLRIILRPQVQLQFQLQLQLHFQLQNRGAVRIWGLIRSLIRSWRQKKKKRRRMRRRRKRE